MDDEFFARVGHDLRGELATMLAGVHYVLRYEKELGDSSRDMLDRVRGAGDRLKRLLDEFDHAVWLHADASRPLSVALFEAGELMHRASAQLAGAAAARGVRILVEHEHGASGLMAQGDVELLRVAMEYVMGLAITRSRDQVVQVRISAAGGAPVVTIVDEAGPVSPEPLSRLLEPFGERAAIPLDPVAPRRRERLGLGLAIARAILQAHGGSLKVDLTPGLADSGPSPDGERLAPPGAGLRFTCVLARSDHPPTPRTA